MSETYETVGVLVIVAFIIVTAFTTYVGAGVILGPFKPTPERYSEIWPVEREFILLKSNPGNGGLEVKAEDFWRKAKKRGSLYLYISQREEVRFVLQSNEGEIRFVDEILRREGNWTGDFNPRFNGLKEGQPLIEYVYVTHDLITAFFVGVWVFSALVWLFFFLAVVEPLLKKTY